VEKKGRRGGSEEGEAGTEFDGVVLLSSSQVELESDNIILRNSEAEVEQSG